MTLSLLPLARMGHPILSKKAEPVDLLKLEEIKIIVSNMKFTLDSIGDRLGLAAPQVHIPLQIVIFSIPKTEPSPRYDFDCEEVPFTVMINPEITQTSHGKVLDGKGVFRFLVCLVKSRVLNKLNILSMTLTVFTITARLRAFMRVLFNMNVTI